MPLDLYPFAEWGGGGGTQLHLIPGRKGLTGVLGEVPYWVQFTDQHRLEVRFPFRNRLARSRPGLHRKAVPPFAARRSVAFGQDVSAYVTVTDAARRGDVTDNGRHSCDSNASGPELACVPAVCCQGESSTFLTIVVG